MVESEHVKDYGVDHELKSLAYFAPHTSYLSLGRLFHVLLRLLAASGKWGISRPEGVGREHWSNIKRYQALQS